MRFFEWCDRHKIGEIADIEPLHVAAYVEALGKDFEKPTVKQHLAAIRMLFDWLVTGQIVATNPAHSVRGPKHVVKTGKTTVLTGEQGVGVAAFCRGPLARRGRARFTLSRWIRSPGRGSGWRVLLMYKRIILAVDLAEPSPAPKGLPQALELAKVGGAALRLVNVQPVVPATFMEYVPADFDVEQSKRAKEALDALLDGIDLPADRKSVPRARAVSTTSSCRTRRTGTRTSSSSAPIAR